VTPLMTARPLRPPGERVPHGGETPLQNIGYFILCGAMTEMIGVFE
jgi:hypothetical protein